MYEPASKERLHSAAAPVSVFPVVYVEVPVYRLDGGVLGYPLVCARRVREQVDIVIDVFAVGIGAAADKLRHLHVYPHICRAQAYLLGVGCKAQADRTVLRIWHDALRVQFISLCRCQANGVVKVAAVIPDILDAQIGCAYAVLRDRDARINALRDKLRAVEQPVERAYRGVLVARQLIAVWQPVQSADMLAVLEVVIERLDVVVAVGTVQEVFRVNELPVKLTVKLQRLRLVFVPGAALGEIYVVDLVKRRDVLFVACDVKLRAKCK